jgi:hypothetical protein
MGLLNKLFSRNKSEGAAAAEPPPCPHTALTPRWDSVEDMGREDRVSGYTCQGCNGSFSPAEGRALLASEGERVMRDLAG